jgi:hypothetical protein
MIGVGPNNNASIGEQSVVPSSPLSPAGYDSIPPTRRF